MAICYNRNILLMQFGLRLKLAGYLVLRFARVLNLKGFDSVRKRWRWNFLLVSGGDV